MFTIFLSYFIVGLISFFIGGFVMAEIIVIALEENPISVLQHMSWFSSVRIYKKTKEDEDDDEY